MCFDWCFKTLNIVLIVIYNQTNNLKVSTKLTIQGMDSAPIFDIFNMNVGSCWTGQCCVLPSCCCYLILVFFLTLQSSYMVEGSFYFNFFSFLFSSLIIVTGTLKLFVKQLKN